LDFRRTQPRVGKITLISVNSPGRVSTWIERAFPAIIFSLMRVNFAETSAPVNFLLGAKASVYEAVFMMNGLPPPEPLLIHTLLE
jgi:hypothetical protein